MSREQALEFLRGEAADASLSPGVWRQIGIAMHDDVLAGDIGIHLSADLRVAEFGLSIDPRRQGRGLGTEAVQALVSLLLRHTPVATIVAATDARNSSEEHTPEPQSLMRIPSAVFGLHNKKLSASSYLRDH